MTQGWAPPPRRSLVRWLERERRASRGNISGGSEGGLWGVRGGWWRETDSQGKGLQEQRTLFSQGNCVRSCQARASGSESVGLKESVSWGARLATLP